LNVEGLGRQLYPELDLWKTAKPIMEQWMRERLGPRATFRRIRNQLPELAEAVPELTQLLSRRLRKLEAAGSSPGADERSLNALREEIRRSRRHAVGSVVGAALLVGACLLLLLPNGQETWLAALEGAMGALGVVICWRALRE